VIRTAVAAIAAAQDGPNGSGSGDSAHDGGGGGSSRTVQTAVAAGTVHTAVAAAASGTVHMAVAAMAVAAERFKRGTAGGLGISCGFGGGGGGSKTVQTADCWRLGSSSSAVQTAVVAVAVAAGRSKRWWVGNPLSFWRHLTSNPF
jgi:hypothetical protein